MADDGRHSLRFRFMVWVNIACQLLLPLGLPVTPLVTEAQAENRVPPESGLPRVGDDSVHHVASDAGASVKLDSLPVLGGAEWNIFSLKLAVSDCTSWSVLTDNPWLRCPRCFAP